MAYVTRDPSYVDGTVATVGVNEIMVVKWVADIWRASIDINGEIKVAMGKTALRAIRRLEEKVGQI